MVKSLPALTAILFAATSAVPTASQAQDVNSVRIAYADLNLASDAGANVLQQRIRLAAQVACGYEDSRQYDVMMATKTCRTKAVAGARPAFEAALATARHPSVTVGAAAAIIVTAE